MTDHPSPPARQMFAQRLKIARMARGYRTARSLAQVLEIDENRYTRYERAEVEPDIELIGRICETLRVTPNDLLGPAGHGSTAAHGFGESAVPSLEGAQSGADSRRDKAAWALARAVAELDGAASQSPCSEGSPLAVLQRAGHWFEQLSKRPYAAVGEILRLPAVAAAPVATAEELKRLIEAFTQDKPDG